MNNILDTALELHTLGYSVIPIRSDGSKVPALPTWKQHTQERANEAIIRAWFDQSDHDLGVIQGAVSGGAELTEIEGRAATELPALRALAHDSGLGNLWDTITHGWVEMSPSGGFHFHYRVTGTTVPGNLKLARAADKLVLAETRGEGGQVVVAPSRHHASGKPWLRLAGGPATAPVLTAEQRDAFHTLLRTLDVAPPPPAATSNRPVTPRDPADGITPGDDYENKVDWTDILVPHGWTHVTTRGRTRYWRRPGKTDGLSATTGHADDRDRFYCFSSSTEFSMETPYTKLGALAVLEHGGDHSTAARELARRGFGQQRNTHTSVSDLRGLIATARPTHPDPGTADDDEEEDADLPTPSWKPVNLAPYLDGTHVPERPTMLTRSDNVALLYPGLVHDFHGESESGKSLVIQAEAATRIQTADPVLYVDFESGPGPIVNRLLDLGCTQDQIANHFVYIRPEASPYALAELEAWGDLLEQPFALVVLDGVTDALGQYGAASKDNDDISRWHRAVPRMLSTHTGAAVVLIDHVIKSQEGRGRFAIGGQTKMAAIDGASYSVEVTEPIGKGLRGIVTLRIGKDRPGEVRPQCGTWRALDRTQEAARIVIDSTGGPIAVEVLPPTTHVSQSEHNPGTDPFRPTGVMEKLSRLLESRREPISQNQLLKAYHEDGGKAKNATLYDAFNLLVDEGYATEQTGARNARMLRSATVYRQHNDPSSDAYVAPLDGLIAHTSPLHPNLTATSPRGGTAHLPPPTSPVGGVGEVEPAQNSRPHPTALDPASGLLFDRSTGEVFSQ